MFSCVIKQYGVISVGTLYRECMGRIVFHHKQLYTNYKLPGECDMMRYEPKRILLCIFKGLCGRFLATVHIQQSNVILEKICNRAISLLLIN